MSKFDMTPMPYLSQNDAHSLDQNGLGIDSEARPADVASPPIVFDLPPPEELRAATRRVAEQRRASRERRELYHPFKAQDMSQNNAALDMV